jgi:hypothetical protein
MEHGNMFFITFFFTVFIIAKIIYDTLNPSSLFEDCATSCGDKGVQRVEQTQENIVCECRAD